MTRTNICYVTSSEFKKEECKVLVGLDFNKTFRISDMFEFRFITVDIKERLEISIEAMVKFEVNEAYHKLRVPCIVEHAGLIFKKYYNEGYPGGLTKPMWNSLGENFVRETNSGGQDVIARAVVAYCDGKKVWTFVGETEGLVAKEPRGAREFYWDTIFVPEAKGAPFEGMTYAEIVADNRFGLEEKMRISQSAKAMRRFLAYMDEHGIADRTEFWMA